MRTPLVLLLLGLVLGIHLMPRPVHAEDEGFFPQGFASSPLDDEKTEGGSKRAARAGKAAKQTPAPQASKTGSGWDELVDGESESSSSSAPGIVPNMDDPSAVEILAIDGVVNFVNKAHAKEVLQGVIATSKQHNIHIRKLYAMGDHKAVLKSVDLKTRGAFMAAVVQVVRAKKPPKDIPVKVSPSWIFYTTSGRYVAEGLDALEQLTTLTGKLKWPESAKMAAPTPKSAESINADLKSKTERERIQALVNSLKQPEKSKKRPHRSR